MIQDLSTLIRVVVQPCVKENSVGATPSKSNTRNAVTTSPHPPPLPVPRIASPAVQHVGLAKLTFSLEICILSYDDLSCKLW
jgi:hypothetical protein